MNSIKRYHFHEGDEDSPHFEVFDAIPYLKHHGKKAFTAHRHSYYQLIWFHEAGTHYIDFNTFDHPANALFFIDKGQVHKFCNVSSNSGSLLHFNDTFLNRFDFNHENWIVYKTFNELNQPFIVLDDTSRNQLENFYSLILQELELKHFNYKEQLYFLFRLMLTTAERLRYSHSKISINTSPGLDLAVKFKQLVEDNLQKPYDVVEYAEMLNMSVKQLSSLVKKYLGDSPGHYINEKKAIEAKRLLSNTNQSIKEVAYFLGFQQSTYFTKFFKKYTGFTPKEFRESNFEG
ncbi:MAG: AraC family transcriptional regulator [bacterium]|nr:AraC family transcriptional regulator [bacterium]